MAKYITLVTLLLFLPRPVPAGAAPRPTKILFVHRNLAVDAQYVQELRAAGFAVEQRPLTQPLTPQYLRAFHVVVMPDLLTLDAAFHVGATDVPAFWDTNLPALRRYVAEGGGLLIGTFFQEAGEALAAAYDRVLAPWEAGFRAAQIVDPEHIAPVPGAGAKVADGRFYCWTDRVFKHPATAGVRRILYPVCNLRWDDCYTTPPVLLKSKAWQPLVRALAGAYNAKTNKNYQWQEPDGNDDVIAAARAAGKGRVAIVSLCSYYTFYRPYTKETSLGENHHGRIDGVPLRGEGDQPSDLDRLLTNLYRWLGEPAAKAGFGGPAPAPPAVTDPGVRRGSPDRAAPRQVIDWERLQMPPTWRHRPIPQQINGQTYYDEQPDPTLAGDTRYFRALIGAHTALSDGKGTVAQYAAAARKAGYSLVAFTERFENLGGKERWEQLRADCLKHSSDSLVCLPGIDIADPEAGRYLIVGQPNYPNKTWLTPDGRYFTANNAMSLGFTTHLAAIARPGAGPHQYRLFKHYQGIAVATYRAGKQVDDGYEAYAWAVASGSNPIPLAVHEVYSPAEVPLAAAAGFQQIVPSDTVAHAADYFRCALAHFFDCPQRYFISEGPLLDPWTIFNKDRGKPEENRDRYRIALGARADVPLREVILYADGALYRRWTPGAKQFQERVDGRHAWQRHFHLVATDAEGRRAISPALRTVGKRYTVRCGDRQNWLGHVGAFYTGTRLEWLDLHLPVKEVKEGDTTFTSARGANLAPMLEFPLISDRVCVTDFLLGQRYPNVEHFEEIAYDAAPMRVTMPARLYEGRVRLTNYTPRANGPLMTLCDVSIRTRRQAERVGEGVWPWFAEVQGRYHVRAAAGWQSGEITPATRLDLHPGDVVGGLMVLSQGLRLDGRRFGLAAPAATTVPAETRFAARFLFLNKSFAGWSHKNEYDAGDHAADLVKAASFDPPAAYGLGMIRGPLEGIAYLARLRADDCGAYGNIVGGAAPCDLPLLIEGLNQRWTAGVWRSNRPTDFTDQFGFLDGVGLTTLDVLWDASFYAGNLVLADQPDVSLNIEDWTADRIVVEAHNPTDAPLTVTLRTPAEITGLRRLEQRVTVPAGSSVRVKG